MTRLTAHAEPVSHRLQTDLGQTLTPGERRRMALRLGGSLAAAALLAVGLLHRWIFPGQEPIAATLLGTGALVAVLPVLRAGVQGFVAHDPDATVDQLVSLALLAAIAGGQFETAILIPLVMEVGHFFKERSILGARAAIDGLKTLQPSTAFRLAPDGEEAVPVERLRPGDRLIVRPGEALPADGRVVRGSSAVDQSSMTGESLPDEVAPGSQVYAGTLNLSGVVEVEVTGLGEASAIGRIVELLRQAERSKAPIVKLIERHAGHYLPLVLLVAGAVLLFTQELSRAIAILVVSCPCALVLASPSAMTASLAVASRLGILIKNSRFLEVLGEIDTVILDKTGTATMGLLEVVEVRPLGGGTEDEVLAEAAVCARGSRHPVSRAVLATAKGLTAGDAEVIQEVPGRGVAARRDGAVIRLGSSTWLREVGLAVPDDPPHAGSVVWVTSDHHVVGLLLLADRPRPGGRTAIETLRGLGVERIALITGDRSDVARQVAEELGVDEFLAGCLPEAKLEVVAREKARGRRVMMVGDGVNDALALDRADIGVAMGAMGSDMAVKSADVALMGNDLMRLPQMMRLAKRTRAVITQNVVFAIGSGLTVMTLAGLGLVGPVAGALLQNIGTFVVIANSGRLLRFEPGLPDRDRTGSGGDAAAARPSRVHDRSPSDPSLQSQLGSP